MKNKKAINVVMENLVYLLFVIVFISFIFFSITDAGRQSTLYEQIYAKQIALLIDGGIPDEIIKLNVEPLIEIAGENGVNLKDTIKIVDNRVIVKLSQDGGYSYSFFNDVEPRIYFENERRILVIQIK